jgi:ubiquinone/menaquinone biosynthesis C-methylase UbiE
MTTTKSDILGRMDALADATRSRFLLLLEQQELTVSELQAIFQLPQSTVSRHVKILGDAGWVVSRVDGTSRWYAMHSDRLPPPAVRLWQAIRDEVSAVPAASHDQERMRSILSERRTTSKAFFSSAAGQWDALREELFGRHVELAGLLGLLDERWVVADLGCGTGQIAANLARFVHRVIAVDDSSAMLNAARIRLAGFDNVDVREGELESLPIEAGELDAAVIFLALHHVVQPDRVLAQVQRALRPGGRLLVVDMMPHERDEYRRDMGHVWQGFAEPELSTWFTEAGLEPRRYEPLSADPNAVGPTLFAATAIRPAGTTADTVIATDVHEFA